MTAHLKEFCNLHMLSVARSHHVAANKHPKMKVQTKKILLLTSKMTQLWGSRDFASDVSRSTSLLMSSESCFL